MFFLVTGAAAAGKSTLIRLLPTRLDNIECHDSDEKPVRDEYQRCSTLEEWIALALGAQREGCDFLLATQSPLGELLAPLLGDQPVVGRVARLRHLDALLPHLRFSRPDS